MANASPSMMDQLLPDVAAKDMQAQRAMALGQMLMQQGAQSGQGLGQTQMVGPVAIRNSPVAGLASMLQSGLGAYSQAQGMQGMIDASRLRAQQMGQLLGLGSPGDTAGTSPLTPDQALQMEQNAGGAPGPTMAAANRIGSPAVSASQGAMAPGAWSIPGMPKSIALSLLMTDPQAFAKAQADAYALPPDIKALATAYGHGSPEFQQAARNLAVKQSNPLVDVRPLNTLFDPTTRQPVYTAPDAEGRVITQAGGPQMSLAPGAGGVNQAIAAAQTAGRQQVTPQPGWNTGTNAPGWTTQLGAAGGTAVDPNTGQPAGGPPAPSGGLNPGRFGSSAFAPPPGQQAGGNIIPAAPPGVENAAKILSDQGAADYGSLRAAAKDSPDRLNVLGHIADLSRQVATGPWADKKAEFLAGLSNVPVLGGLLAGAKNDAAKFEILNKYMSQNIGYAYGANNASTDSMRATFEHSNPNPQMLDQAIQAVVPRLQGVELALQDKTNLADRFMATPGNQTKFAQIDAAWRNAVDPDLYTLKALGPQSPAAQQMLAGMSAARRHELMQKGAALNRLLQGQF